MSTAKDTNVYQHLLRAFRLEVAEALGVNLKGREVSGAAVLTAAVERSLLELDVIVEELDRREDGQTPLNYPLAAICDRLNLALRFSSGVFDPDDPFETSGTEDYFPGGRAAYFAAMKAKHGKGDEDGSVEP